MILNLRFIGECNSGRDFFYSELNSFSIEDFKRVETEENKNGNFTYKGLRVLFNYLDDLSEDIEENIVFDCIALCCDYVEYKDLNQYLKDFYQKEELKEIKEEYPEEEDFKEFIQEEINNKTTLIKFEDDLNEGFIIQDY